MKFKYLAIALSMLLINFNIQVFAEDHNHHHEHKEMKGGEVTSKSIYQLDSKWLDQNNKKIKLKDFSGKPVILTMLYTGCTKSCPIIIGHLKSFYDSLSNEEKNKVNFVVLSFDSKRDTPKNLKKFADKNKLGKNFYLLNGSDDSILEIASLLGIKYSKTDDGEFSHTNKIILLNKKGEVFHQNEGLKENIEESKKILKELF